MRFYSKRCLLRIITLSTLLLFAFTSIAFAASNTKFDYVALGDSLAAGWTPYSTEVNEIIDKSYPDIIAEKLDGEGVLGDYNNFGFPGYTTVDVMAKIDSRDLQNAGRVATISSAEIITLDIGANDLLDSIPALMADPAKAPEAIGAVVDNITTIICTLKDMNQSANIYLMGYYNAFPYRPVEQQAPLTDLIGQFNSALRFLASQTGITYVDTYTIMDKHLTKYLPTDNIHPSVSGYRAIAKEFWSLIKVDFLRGLK